MAGNFWTAEEEQVLRRMIEAGHSVQAVTEVLKSRTQGAVEKKKGQLGLRMRGTFQPNIDWATYQALTGDAPDV